MSKKEKKTIKVEIGKEVWKKLKILSIQKEMTVDEIVNLGLEFFVSKKKVESEESSEQS